MAKTRATKQPPTSTTTAAVGFENPDEDETRLAVGIDSPEPGNEERPGWEMCALIEGVDTRDSQMVRVIRPGATRFPDQEAALMWLPTDSHGGGDPGASVRVGTIRTFGRDGDQIMLSGDYTDTPEGWTFAAAVASGEAGWPSVDLGDEDVIITEEPKPEELAETDEVYPDTRVEFVSALLCAVTIVQIPAQEGTWIRPAEAPAEEEAEPEPMAAAAAPLRPPPSWFDEPDMADGPTPFTVTDDGRVFGVIGLKGDCHSGFRDRCVPFPTGVDFSRFHQGGEVVCDDGARVAVGHITANSGHAPLDLGGEDRSRFYDHSAWSAALVRAGENRWGTWVAGMLNPSATDEQVVSLRALTPSGDWEMAASADASPWLIDTRRKLGSTEHEMVAILMVTSPGFRQPRQPYVAARVASGVLEAMVASGASRESFAKACGCDHEATTASALERILGPIAFDVLDRRAGTTERARATGPGGDEERLAVLRMRRVADRVGV